MKKDDNKTCYLCGKTEFFKRPGKIRDNEQLFVLECRSCGLVFLSSNSHINKEFYKNSNMHEGDKSFLNVEYWSKVLDWDDERRFRFIKLLIQNKNLLDFGCGVGGFLLKAKKIAQEVTGIEIEKTLQTHFNESGLSVFESLSDLELQENRFFDVITLFHVLEHIPDPRTILVELHPFLKKEGQIIIEVPHAHDALLTFYNCKPFSNFAYWSCHLFLFSVSTLKILAEQAGFCVNYVKQVQRYPLSNHLHWLSEGKPGGHEKWSFLDSEVLHDAYEKQLSSIGHCDTLLASFSKPPN